MKTIAVYGGSFNPPHIGHAMVAQWILWTGKADEVLFVPSANHPLGKTHAPLEDRVDMLWAMTDDIDPRKHKDTERVLVTDIEKAWEGEPVYTYDLLHELQVVPFGKMREGWKWRFVIGADILEETHKWHKWDKVREEFDLIILGREGYPSPDGSPIIPDFSSSEIRRLIEAGDERWRDMVTPGVRELLPGPYSS
jgi:nicotinate-nucleotide adenylyltransferase